MDFLLRLRLATRWVATLKMTMWFLPFLVKGSQIQLQIQAHKQIHIKSLINQNSKQPKTQKALNISKLQKF